MLAKLVFFTYNNNGPVMLGINMRFKRDVRVMNIFRRDERAPIRFNPVGLLSTKQDVNFLLERVHAGESNIGIHIEVKETDYPPQLVSFSWVADDGRETEHPFSAEDIVHVNRTYFRVKLD